MIRYYKNLPPQVEVQNERIRVQPSTTAEEPFDLRRWKEPPHLALANLRPDTPAVLAFTRRYGVVWFRGWADPMWVLPANMIRLRDFLRQGWEGKKDVLGRMWADIEVRMRGEPTGVEIVVEDLWTLIRLTFLQDWVSGRPKVCGNPECPAPYFLAVRKGQKYCSHKCAVLINVRRFRAGNAKPRHIKKSWKRGKHAKAKKA
jgi:hypothetical protein